MKKLILLGTALAALVATAPRTVRQDAPDAVLVKVTGAVQLKHGATTTAAAVGAKLVNGDQLIPASGGAATVVYRNGVRQDVTTTTTIQAPAGGGTGGDMFTKTVRVLAQAATSDARSQPNRQGMIRPIPGEPVLVMPRIGIKVLASHPTFVWHKVNGASGYTIQLRAQGQKPVRFTTGSDTTWTLPASEQALAAGTEYWWTVAPSGSGRPTREQNFRVIADGERADLDQNLGMIGTLGLDPATDGQLLTAVVYADFGLYYEAARLLDALESTGSPLSADVWFLKGEVLDELGHVDESRMAFDKGDKILR